jgi:hypothetical protein
MELLPGAVVAAAVGLVTGLAITEYRGWRERKRRKGIIANLFRHEVSLNKKVLQQIKDKTASDAREGRAIAYVGPPLPRDAYSNCIADLSLLSREAADPVLAFYHRLTDVDFVVQEGYLRRSLYPAVGPERMDRDEQALREWARFLFPHRGEA